MYQLRTLWWRSHAHATNSAVLPVAATSAKARRTSASIPTDRITSVRFAMSIPPFHLPAWSVEDGLTEGPPSLGESPDGCVSGGWSLSDPCVAFRLWILCHHVNLTNDLAVAHLQRRFDRELASIRVLALLPKRHSILADDLSLEAVRRLLPEGRSQMLGYLHLSSQFEGRDVRGDDVDDT